MAQEEGDNRPQLHPAEGRGYRELYAACRHLLERWKRLGDAVDDTPFAQTLTGAAGYVEELLGELEPRTARYDLHGKPSAQGLGARIGDARGLVLDKSLDTGPAVRLAVLDIEHIVTLLLQLSRMAKVRTDENLRDFAMHWAKRLRPVVGQVRSAAVALGDDPDRVAKRLDDSPVGQAVHRAGWALGTLGEWLDRRAAGGDEPEPEEEAGKA
ncbi:MAG: hypothetical protein ABR536_01165 [Solirubrobacterales bacterium]